MTDHAAIAADLVAWADEEAAMRARLVETGALFGGYHPQMQALHERNADRLAEVIHRIGWPSASVVGERAAEAAWRIAQHAISRPDFLRRCAALVGDAAARGEAPGGQAAMMIDRIRVFEGRPQVYGCSFDWDESGQLSPLPIEDPEGVDAAAPSTWFRSRRSRRSCGRGLRGKATARPPTAPPAGRSDGRRRRAGARGLTS